MNKDQCTIWLKIKKKLESEIILEKYKESQKMPSITQVSVYYQCGRSTAKKILEEMFREGYLDKRKGIGYFVKKGTREVLLEKHKNLWNNQAQQLIEEALQMGTYVIGKEESISSKIEKLFQECKIPSRK